MIVLGLAATFCGNGNEGIDGLFAALVFASMRVRIGMLHHLNVFHVHHRRDCVLRGDAPRTLVAQLASDGACYELLL